MFPCLHFDVQGPIKGINDTSICFHVGYKIASLNFSSKFGSFEL